MTEAVKRTFLADKGIAMVAVASPPFPLISTWNSTVSALAVRPTANANTLFIGRPVGITTFPVSVSDCST